MLLDPVLKKTIELNAKSSFDIFQDIKGNLDYLINTWGCEDGPEFTHGFIIGDMLGQAFATTRTTLGRALSKEEQKEVSDLIKSYKIPVKDLISRLKKA